MKRQNSKLLSEYEMDFDLSESTKESYLYLLTRVARDIGKKGLLDLKPPDVIKWYRGRSWSQSYRGVLWAALKSLFQWAVDGGKIREKKAFKILTYKFKRSGSPERGHIPLDMIGSVIRAANTARARVVCVLFFGTGLRRSALTALKWSDFDLSRHRLVVRAEITKGNKKRSVGLASWVEGELVKYRESFLIPPHNNDFLFRSPSRVGHIVDESIYNDFRSAAKRAGVEKSLCHPHAARHSFAMSLLGKVDIRKIQKTMGHSRLDTTAIYLNASDVEVEEAVRNAMSHTEPPGSLPL